MTYKELIRRRAGQHLTAGEGAGFGTLEALENELCSLQERLELRVRELEDGGETERMHAVAQIALEVDQVLLAHGLREW